MTKKDKTNQETKFDFSFCMEIMEKIMGQYTEGCDCAEMISKDTPPDMQKIMSQMESCCGIRKEEAASQ